MLRGKRWSLPKRRTSLRTNSGGAVQQKPTTANRTPLELDIRDTIARAPSVYNASTTVSQELGKCPAVGERDLAAHAEGIGIAGPRTSQPPPIIVRAACSVPTNCVCGKHGERIGEATAPPCEWRGGWDCGRTQTRGHNHVRHATHDDGGASVARSFTSHTVVMRCTP